MPDLVDNVTSKKPEGSDGRSMCMWARKDGPSVTGLLEWVTRTPESFGTHIADVVERIPKGGNTRTEEARTLRIDGVFKEGPRTALVYQCSRQPINLRDVLLTIPKPTGEDRRSLSRIITTQVRSLHVHFRLRHMALRTESFVFFPDGSNRPNLAKPYTLDWARASAPGMYQHPQYRADKPFWCYEVWSLMMILSEIAEWRPLDAADQDEGVLREKKLERKKLVTSSNWRGPATAQIFQYGFGYLERGHDMLERFNHWDIKRFYDKLCELLAP